MGVKITGFDDLEKSITDLQNQVEELPKEQSVTFEELFHQSFMKAHTKFSTFDELLLAGNYVIHSQEDFDAIPQSELDAFISKNTTFDSWDDMLSTAGTEYLSKRFNSLSF